MDSAAGLVEGEGEAWGVAKEREYICRRWVYAVKG